jgi:hypothetical protein
MDDDTITLLGFARVRWYTDKLESAHAAGDISKVQLWSRRILRLQEGRLTNADIECELRRLRDPEIKWWRKLAARDLLQLYPELDRRRVDKIAKRMSAVDPRDTSG